MTTKTSIPLESSQLNRLPMPKKLTQDEILEAFTRIHGARYDYSLVRYANSTAKVTVICREHGAFDVTAGHHKNGVGCRHCYFDSIRVGIEQFIKVSTQGHAGRYDYSAVSPDIKVTDRVPIRCIQHNLVFWQLASAHLAGHTGCRACLSNKLTGPAELLGQYKEDNLPLKSFVQRAVKRHGPIYDYSKFVYQGAGVKGEIVCPEHGVFWQSPSNHLRGTRCPQCAKALAHKDPFKAMCKTLGVDYWRALKRREAGMSDEKIFEEALLRSERVVNPITVHGTTYPNMESAVRALDPPASSATISRWIADGIMPEVAFAKIPNPGYANGIIYLVEHEASNRQYVGLTIVSIEERWRRHVEQAAMGRIKSVDSLHAAVREHGPDQFSIRVIDRGTTKAGLENRERDWIAKLNTRSPNGFNISPGGGSGGAHGRQLTIDGVFFPSVRAASEHVARTRGITVAAAEGRIRVGRLDIQAPSKPGEAVSKTPAYKAWSRLVHCVFNPKSRDYTPGLELHKPWLDFHKFLADVGQPPKAGMAFSRLDKVQGFYPGNCRWMTKSEASKLNAAHMAASGKLVGRRKREL